MPKQFSILWQWILMDVKSSRGNFVKYYTTIYTNKQSQWDGEGLSKQTVVELLDKLCQNSMLGKKDNDGSTCKTVT